MPLTFCPSAAAWGDIATWLAGIATVAAVVVALFTSRAALRHAVAMRALDRKEAAKREDETAQRLAIVIDHELFVVGGQLAALVGSVDDIFIRLQPVETIQLFHTNLPTGGMPLTTRFVDQFGVFGVEAAANLMLALSEFNVLSARPAPIGIERAATQIQVLGARSTVSTVRKAIEAFRNARLALRPWMERYQAEFQDFVDTAALVSAEMEAGDPGTDAR